MKLNTAPANTVEMNGVASTSQFTIRASAKAFSILSDGLYSNKIRAIVRELSTNALDSHIAAGRADQPFTVNIPNILAPWFSVRDYGVGLSHEEVKEIYTSYFTSTKSDSDDFVGALGLGSKSPFSYTDNFSVTAIKDGRKGLYSAYIDDTGVPSIALMSETETDEPNGVEVRLGVNDRDDFYKFAREAAYVYKHFAVRPEITGESVEFKDTEYFRKDILPGIHIRKNSYHSRNVIVMGSIEYPIQLPHGALRGFGSDRVSENQLQHISNSGDFEIHVPIGAVEMSASREELSYTSKTIDFIYKTFCDIDACLESVFETGLKGLANEWDITEYLVEQSIHQLFGVYAHRYVKDHKPKLTNGSRAYWNDIRYTVDRAKELNINLRVIDSNSYSAPVQTPKDRLCNDHKSSSFCYEIKTGGELFLVDGSQGVAAISRVTSWCRAESYYGTAVVAVPIDRKKPMLWDQFLEDLYYPPAKYIRDLSEFPKAERSERAAATPVYEFKLVHHDRPPFSKVTAQPFGTLDDVESRDVQLAYVKLYRSETHINDEKTDVRSHFAQLLKSGILNKQKIRLFGVRATDLEAVENDEDWLQFDVAVKNALSNLTVEDFVASRLNSLDTIWTRLYRKHRKDIAGSPLSDLFDLYNKNVEFDFASIKELAAAYNDTEIRARYEKAKKTVDDIINRYPLISHVHYLENLDMVVDYIKTVDIAKGEKA
jgi:hypothetical protein